MSRFTSWFKNLFKKKPVIEQPVAPPERIQRAAASILENEGLTPNLDDETAAVVLDWGVARAKAIAQDTAGLDETAAHEAMPPRMRALRRMLRAVNRWIPRRLEMSADNNRTALEGVLEQAALVYDRDRRPTEEQIRAFLDHDLPSDPVQAIVALRRLIEGAEERP